MNRRGRKREEHENLERWLVSYADFITLLFAFFVVMYSISSVNEGKYKVLSETLNEAFSDPYRKPRLAETLDPMQQGERPKTRSASDTPIFPDRPPANPDIVDIQGGKTNPDQAQLEDTASEVERVLAPYIQDRLISVRREGAWIEVEMQSGLLFASGSANLSLEAIPMLEKLTDIFKNVPNAVNVEGHTDNKPISTREFPSNWELSAARAASVVHQFMRGGVDPARMSAIAYGEYHPIADNGTEDGRYKNRRVVIILQSRSLSRYGTSSAGGAGAQPAGTAP